MKRIEAEAMIAPVKERLKAAFPKYANLVDETSVHLLKSNDNEEQRRQIAAELKARYKEPESETAGETVVGELGFAIEMYYQRISKEVFKHYLLHEFGHVISINACKELYDEAQEDGDYNRDTPLRSGVALWSELIAEVIAYRLEDGEKTPVSWNALTSIEALMDEAVNAEIFAPYPFAFYCAMFFEDPVILDYIEQYPNAAVGTNHCEDSIMPFIEASLTRIDNQLFQEEYWIINRQDLVELGNCVNDLWDYCRHRRLRKVLEMELNKNQSETDK